jgi:glycosyltransferase involved in cell wall biosynthesis
MASGIADYSFELLPLIGRRATVDVVAPKPRWPRRLQVPPGATLVDPALAAERAGRYDATFYHLGNNPHHEFVYEAALARPAIAVFHDFVLHHLVAHLMVEAGRRRDRYTELLREEYGEAGERLAELRVRRIATDYEKFVFPLNEHVVRASSAVVVHSHDSAERMRQIAPDVPVSVIPHHAGSPPPSVAGVTRQEARARLGLAQGSFLVGHFGFITRPKQPSAVIGGFERLVKVHPDSLLVMTGADHTGGGLDRLVRRHGLDGRVLKAGYVDLEHFYLYLKAVDATINLRYPSAGESSGTFARALAEGRAAIVNDLGSFAEVPNDVSLKVEIDGDQARQIGEHLIGLAEDEAFKAGIEANARRYATTVLDPARCAELYMEVAQAATATSMTTATTTAAAVSSPTGRR